MESEETLLTRQSQLNRSLYQQKAISNAEPPENQPTQYLSYDFNTGRGRLKKVSGDFLYAQSITNGAVVSSNTVRMRGDRYDAMPRIKTQENTPTQSDENFKMYALMATYRIHIQYFQGVGGQGNSPYYDETIPIFIGNKAQTITLDYTRNIAGLGEISIPDLGFVAGSGLSGSDKISYTPQRSDGFIGLRVTTDSIRGIAIFYNIYFYVTDGKRIKELSYVTQSNKNIGTTITVVGDKIYICIKEDTLDDIYFGYLQDGHWGKVTIIALDKSFKEIDRKTFNYSGSNNIDTSINEEDWRNNYTNTFLITPPKSDNSCFDTYQGSNRIHLKKSNKKIVDAGGDFKSIFDQGSGNTSAGIYPRSFPYTNPLVRSGRFKGVIKSGQYIAGNTCSTTLKNKNIFFSVSNEVAAIARYCGIYAVAVYE